mmetsp:Transcript_12839/g.32032  ORF Transcript_12839/g.32032 Transcript_12839/m.32032 type:complete len:286 (-) Transcript_12839:509-1366(-)
MSPARGVSTLRHSRPPGGALRTPHAASRRRRHRSRHRRGVPYVWLMLRTGAARRRGPAPTCVAFQPAGVSRAKSASAEKAASCACFRRFFAAARRRRLVCHAPQWRVAPAQAAPLARAGLPPGRRAGHRPRRLLRHCHPSRSRQARPRRLRRRRRLGPRPCATACSARWSRPSLCAGALVWRAAGEAGMLGMPCVANSSPRPAIDSPTPALRATLIAAWSAAFACGVATSFEFSFVAAEMGAALPLTRRPRAAVRSAAASAHCQRGLGGGECVGDHRKAQQLLEM